MRKYQIWKKDAEKFERVRGTIPFDLPVNELMAGVREQAEALAEQTGLEIMKMVLSEERAYITEGPGRKGYKWGGQPGYAVWGGRKVPLENLRTRSINGKREIPLQSYRAFQSNADLGRRAFKDLMRGVSARNYKDGIEGMLEGYGIAKSSVSRHFLRASEEKLRELMERDLTALNLTALLMDGIGFSGTLLVAAVGVDAQGKKHALGLWQGATENSAICQALLDDLIRRGLDPHKSYLFVIDGGKGLRSAIGKTFGERGHVQRCQEHKKRNVVEHLPQSYQAQFRRRLKAAYGMLEYREAKAALLACVRELEGLNPSAAASLKEGMEETLTLHRLELPAALRKSLSTTNAIESPFAYVRQKTGRVKRWQDGNQTQRWAASALLLAEKSWNKISGYTLMEKLREALEKKKFDVNAKGS